MQGAACQSSTDHQRWCREPGEAELKDSPEDVKCHSKLLSIHYHLPYSPCTALLLALRHQQLQRPLRMDYTLHKCFTLLNVILGHIHIKQFI